MRKFLRGVLIFLAVIFVLLLVGPFLVPVPPLEGVQPVEALADADSRFIEIDGVTVHYKQSGQGELALILLHGFGASTFSWREVMQPLSDKHRVVAFDRPGFGLTERPLPGEWQGRSPYSPEAQVDLLFGLMDALGIEEAVLVGNSAGGTVSLNAALANPESIKGLVLVDAAVYGTGGSPAWIRPLLQTPQMDRIGPLFVRSISTRGMDLLTTAWHDQELITPQVIEGYRKPLRAENWDVGLWQMTKASRASNMVERLDALTMPVLVVTGDDDRIVPTDESIRLAEDIPGAELVVFERCGHVPQEECPQAFLEAMEPFLESLK